MSDFGTHSEARQRSLLREAARTALAAFGVDSTDLRLVNFGMNATYRVRTADGRKFALRIGVNTTHSASHLQGELAWLAALSRSTELTVPVPSELPIGGHVAWTSLPAAAAEVPAVLFSWIDAPVLGEHHPRSRARHLGELMASLHQHSRSFTLPPQAELPVLDDYFWNQRHRLAELEPAIGAAGVGILERARALSEPVVLACWDSSQPRAIHADLHGWNLLRLPGRLGVIDFDDCGIGTPCQDIAVASYYQDDPRPFLDNVLEGYAAVATPPDIEAQSLHAHWAQRNLLLLNDLLASQTADLRERIPAFADRTLTRLRRYIDTGEFTHSP